MERLTVVPPPPSDVTDALRAACPDVQFRIELGHDARQRARAVVTLTSADPGALVAARELWLTGLTRAGCRAFVV